MAINVSTNWDLYVDWSGDQNSMYYYTEDGSYKVRSWAKDYTVEDMGHWYFYTSVNVSSYKTLTVTSTCTPRGASTLYLDLLDTNFDTVKSGGNFGSKGTSTKTININVESLSGTYYLCYHASYNNYSSYVSKYGRGGGTMLISSVTATESSFKVTASAGTGISSVSPTSQTIQVGKTSNPITATPASGYYWGYWSDGTTANPYPSFTVTAAKTLTAYGYGNSYKIYYNGNGSTSGSMSYSSHVYGTTKTLTANSYKKIGYTFIGWNTLANGNGTSYSDTQSITTWTPIPSHNSSITLYAQWRPNTYQIQYNSNWPGDSNLGTGIMDNSSHTYDKEYNLTSNNYSYHRKRFLNWNTKQDGTGTTYLNGQLIKNLTPIDNDVFNLYAIWIPDGTVRIEINSESKMAQAYIYYNGKWRLTTPYTCHNEKWKLNGG